MRFLPSTLTTAILTILTTSAYANDSNEQQEKNVALMPIILKAQQQDSVGQRIYHKEDLQRIPNHNKTLTGLLSTHSSVQFSNNAANAGTQGELKPNEISIYGGLVYDNAFLLDGMSLNNRINPGSTASNNHYNSLSGSSQAANINSDLICELEVLDSNVSAAYGGFSGGVISAKTCAPRSEIGQLHGEINYAFENSSLNRYNYIDSEEAQLFEDGFDYLHQKDYFKQSASVNTYTRINEKLAFNAAISQRRSDLKLNPSLTTSANYDQKRQSNNVLLNTYYQASDNTEIQINLQHSEDDDLIFQNNTLHDGFDFISNSNSAHIKIDQKLANVHITQDLSYQDKDSQRRSDSAYTAVWYSSEDKNWSGIATAVEGDSGSLLQNENSLAYEVKAVFAPLITPHSSHTWSMGAGFKHSEASWERPYDHFTYSIQKMGYGSDCLRVDGSQDQWCDASYRQGSKTGQYHQRYDLEPQAKIGIQEDAWHAFLENKMQWKEYLTATLGARIEYDSLTKNNQVAPRSSLNIMPLGDKRLTLTTGWNRYYTNNAFSYQLQDGINNLGQSFSRDGIDGNWNQITSSSAINVLRSQLDTPYSDEWMGAISAQHGGLNYQLKYVKRNFRDEIRLTPIVETADLFDRQYDNVGQGQSDTIIFSVKNSTPIQLFNINHYFDLSATYSDVVRNYLSYDESTLNEDLYVIYDDKVILNSDRPARDYNQPFKARLLWGMQFADIPLELNNVFQFRSGYDYAKRTSLAAADRFEHEGETVRYRYDETHIGSAFRWDMNSRYYFPLGKQKTLSLGLTVNNVLNRKLRRSVTDPTGSVAIGSQMGRQYLADIHYNF